MARAMARRVRKAPRDALARRSHRLLGGVFVVAGVNHFVMPRAYARIVPPPLERHAGLVVRASGVAEVVGGVGALVPATRRPAGLWLVALLLAVFPANVHMARHPERFRGIPRAALYARLPLQPLMMLWAWRATRGEGARTDAWRAR